MLIRVRPPALQPRLSRVTLVLHTPLRKELVKALASHKRLEQRLAFPQLEVTTAPTEEDVTFQSVSWSITEFLITIHSCSAMLFRQLLLDREMVIILHSAVIGWTTGRGHDGSSGVCQRNKRILILGATGISHLYHFSCDTAVTPYRQNGHHLLVTTLQRTTQYCDTI